MIEVATPPVAAPSRVDDEVRDVLRKAKEDLLVNGWAQKSKGMLVNGPHCVLGAIAHACGAKPFRDDDGSSYDMGDPILVPYFEALGFSDCESAYGFNDDLPDVSGVIDRIDKALGA
jgi:hypothetical protein